MAECQNCPICFEEMNDVTTYCKLPSCNHTIHIKCLIQASQYDIRCPVCRSSDPDVKSKRENELSTLDQLEEIIENHRTEERRYQRRRCNLLRNNERYRKINDKLKNEKKTFENIDKELDKRWLSKQKKTWKHDSKINKLKNERRRQQQKTKRIARTLERFCEEKLGPRPNSFIVLE